MDLTFGDTIMVYRRQRTLLDLVVGSRNSLIYFEYPSSIIFGYFSGENEQIMALCVVDTQ